MHTAYPTHAAALFAASQIQPSNWRAAEGDVGQTSEDDVAMEDASGAALVLYRDGSACLYTPA